MNPLEVFVLRITTRNRLDAAFTRVMEASSVASCSIDPDALEIRFLAPVDVARPLIEGIYQQGGLVWSSRHELLLAPIRQLRLRRQSPTRSAAGDQFAGIATV